MLFQQESSTGFSCYSSGEMSWTESLHRNGSAEAWSLGHFVSLTSHHLCFLLWYIKDAVYIMSLPTTLLAPAGRTEAAAATVTLGVLTICWIIQIWFLLAYSKHTHLTPTTWSCNLQIVFILEHYHIKVIYKSCVHPIIQCHIMQCSMDEKDHSG
jgi:hypothetical protein